MLLPVLFLVKPTGCHLSDDHLADLLLREGNYLISENKDLTSLNYRRVSQKGRRKRTKRAYWGFDKLYADAVETKNDFTRLGQMIGGFIKENTQVYSIQCVHLTAFFNSPPQDNSDDYYDYEYCYDSYNN